MKNVVLLLTVPLLGLVLTQCATDNPEAGEAKPAATVKSSHPVAHERTVSLPRDLSDAEEDCVEEIDVALQSMGYHLIRSSGGAYDLKLHVARSVESPGTPEPAAAPGRKQLSFQVENGPVNAVVSLSLHKGPSVVASAKGHASAPSTNSTFEDVRETALQKCLAGFAQQLATLNGMGTTSIQ